MLNMPALSDRVLRPRLAYGVALTALLAACSLSPAATPAPTGSPGGSPTPSPTTPAPTDTPVPTLAPGAIIHPTGASDVILRMEQGGGFVPFEWLITQAPQFTLYGDGTVVFRPQQDEGRIGFEQGLPRFLTGKMTEEGIQALLQYALSTGRLANARDHYDNQMVADASTTVFVFNAAGVEKVVSVYALFELSEPGPDAADRQGFAQLQNLLMNFEQEAAAGTATDVDFYDPELYRVVLIEGAGEPANAPIAWPWDDLTMDDFPPPGDEPGSRSLNMPRELVGQLVEVPSGGQMSIWVETPDGTLVQFALRPLLPDEIAGLPEG